MIYDILFVNYVIDRAAIRMRSLSEQEYDDVMMKSTVPIGFHQSQPHVRHGSFFSVARHSTTLEGRYIDPTVLVYCTVERKRKHSHCILVRDL
jgi:hypothetical protein